MIPCPGAKEVRAENLTCAVPWAGKTFVIMDYKTHETLALVDGKLEMASNPGADFVGAYAWKCVDLGGWFGFVNTAAGTCLARSGNILVARARRNHQEEWFQPRSHPDGGYQLLTPVANELWVVRLGARGHWPGEDLLDGRDAGLGVRRLNATTEASTVRFLEFGTAAVTRSTETTDGGDLFD